MAKTKTITVEGVTYTLQAPEPYSAPIISCYFNLGSKAYESFDESVRAETEMKKAMEKLFKDYVSPMPTTEHHGVVLRELMNFVIELTKASDSFREQSRDKNDRRTLTATSPAAM